MARFGSKVRHGLAPGISTSITLRPARTCASNVQPTRYRRGSICGPPSASGMTPDGIATIEIGVPVRIEPHFAASVHPQTEPSIQAPTSTNPKFMLAAFSSRQGAVSCTRSPMKNPAPVADRPKHPADGVLPDQNLFVFQHRVIGSVRQWASARLVSGM